MESKYKGVDLRVIKCSCGEPDCSEGGISFDGTRLRYHFLKKISNGKSAGQEDYDQEEKTMILNREYTVELIEILQSILESEFPPVFDIPEEESVNEVNNSEKAFLLYYEIAGRRNFKLVYANTEKEAIHKLKKRSKLARNIKNKTIE